MFWIQVLSRILGKPKSSPFFAKFSRIIKSFWSNEKIDKIDELPPGSLTASTGPWKYTNKPYGSAGSDLPSIAIIFQG